MAACRLGSKGKTLADSSFQSEIESIRSFLLMQKSNPSSHGNAGASDESINTHSLVSPRYHKKYKAKQVQTRQNAFQGLYCLMLDKSFMKAVCCCFTQQNTKPTTSDIICNLPVPLANPSNPGCIPKRGSAHTDRRTDAIPADLASSARLWTLIRRCQVNQTISSQDLFSAKNFFPFRS